jgi:hypothetical protein
MGIRPLLQPWVVAAPENAEAIQVTAWVALLRADMAWSAPGS